MSDAAYILPAPEPLPANAEIREVGREARSVVSALNDRIFGQERVIERWDHPDLLALVVYRESAPVAFKVGYAEDARRYYSAKGGVLPGHRRQGLGRALLHAMMGRARQLGYEQFSFHTIPNLHPGMTVLALREEFEVTEARYHPGYEDYILRFERPLAPSR